ncbi:MAG: SDR family oxidoreductase [Gammaproteobacteria bacterium]|nr:SDR family oxidoreductase [Gammaproteobacteria bacterium]
MRLSKLSRSIEGKVAIVTGAASGMGRATAALFADEGAKVAALDINADPLQSVVDEIAGAGYPINGWDLDVADLEAINRVVPDVAAHFGGIDILVNNAGVGAGGPVDGDDYEEKWRRAFDVLITAHVRIIRAALPYLRQSAGGRIVNIASTEGLGATKYASPYTAAKTGVIGLTRSLAVELGTENITVNCVCPGPIRTGMTESIPEDDKREYARRRVALKRYADPEEVAHATLSLVLPASTFITGVALPVDGGLTIKNA